MKKILKWKSVFQTDFTSLRIVRSIPGNLISFMIIAMLPFSAARWRAVQPSWEKFRKTHVHYILLSKYRVTVIAVIVNIIIIQNTVTIVILSYCDYYIDYIAMMMIIIMMITTMMTITMMMMTIIIIMMMIISTPFLQYDRKH